MSVVYRVPPNGKEFQMSSGVVTTNVPRTPDRVVSDQGGTQVKLSSSFPNPVKNFDMSDLRFANPITSFRSGPAFERSLRKPGAILGETTFAEMLTDYTGDIGHEFSMKKVTDYYGYTFSRRPDPTFAVNYDRLTNPGPIGILTSNPDWSINPGSTTPGGAGLDLYDASYGFTQTDSQLSTLGTSFIRATNPIKSQVELLSDVAEALTSGLFLPQIVGKQIVSALINPKSRRDLVKAAGGEYLNYVFGIKPLIDDITKTGKLIDTVNTLVDQWIKDSGTIVRRRRKNPGTFKDAGSKSFSYLSSQVGGQSFYVRSPTTDPTSRDPYIAALALQPPAPLLSQVEHVGLTSLRVSSEITFSAGYQYDVSTMALPVAGGSAEDLMHNAAVRNQLEEIAFGLDPQSAGVAAYNALPFSWLLDWFMNIGDIIDNFRGLQARGVQLLWGYVTETAVR